VYKVSNQRLEDENKKKWASLKSQSILFQIKVINKKAFQVQQ
jgi:hypothetical protein